MGTFDEEDKKCIDVLKAAAAGGLVEVMGEDERDLLVRDETGTSIYLVEKTNWSDEAFGLRIEDGGGFTGLIMTPKKWQTLRDKIDKFLWAREKGPA